MGHITHSRRLAESKPRDRTNALVRIAAFGIFTSQIDAMNVRKGVFASVSFILLGLGVISPMRPAAIAASAEGKVPAPSQVFTPRTALAIYADLQGASHSAIWKAIADNSGPLMQQLQSLHGIQKPSLPTAQLVPGLKGTN